ncbi:sensor histidine kinase [Ruminococcus albus]|uniref:histidine kinase n=1 Tax=Ruminococcus albus (strain ATCC 27210 / DSM 20455 / JCM 14654 / NCDO 2250 / 7) TaxID=697329 RepID=E6UIQ9_RUMA7|nr:HAMP domain-containing sensor histidine kinase [Ruminococcus albus]ADU21361.1 histidine kinase [Ruminococcus albus 7 = DSM 20455]
MVYALFAVITAALVIKIISLRSAARSIRKQFDEKLETDTNTGISIHSADRNMRELAGSINNQLKKLRAEHNRYVSGDAELKAAITNISHDLRTPLTAICGYLEVMKKEEKSEQMEKYLDIIGGRAELMKQLTEELFRYSVILSSDAYADIEDVSVNQVLEDCIMGYYAALSEKGIAPKIELCEEKVIRTVNKNALARTFNNLMNNALKYSDGDLFISLSAEGEIIFSNTAADLTTVQVERLFDRFYTVQAARNSTGLGLSIARTFIEQMNGSISAELADNRLIIRIKL